MRRERDTQKETENSAFQSTRENGGRLGGVAGVEASPRSVCEVSGGPPRRMRSLLCVSESSALHRRPSDQAGQRVTSSARSGTGGCFPTNAHGAAMCLLFISCAPWSSRWEDPDPDNRGQGRAGPGFFSKPSISRHRTARCVFLGPVWMCVPSLENRAPSDEHVRRSVRVVQGIDWLLLAVCFLAQTVT